MASTNFQQNTLITVDWLNEVNGIVWNLFNGNPTPASARAAIGAVGLTGNESVDGVKVFVQPPAVPGIQFPATQVPSADPNVLDDYEEGTWTPGITFGGASVGMTFSIAEGTYTKIGNTVFVSGTLQLTAKGSSTGTMLITGLPFTTPVQNVPFSLRFTAAGTAISGFLSIVTVGLSTTLVIQILPAAGTAIANFNDTHISNTSFIHFSGFYPVS
jgi:hypothetical protein